MRKMTLIMMLGLSSAVSREAFAIVGAEVLAGQRSTSFSGNDESERMNATEVQASVHVDPIPLVPFALGLYYITHDYKPKDDGDVFAAKDFSGSQLGAQVYVWLPLKPTDFSLFAKAGYSFWGEYEALNHTSETDVEGVTADVEGKLKSTGTRLALGMKWSPIALVSALLQFDYAIDTLEFEEIKIDGQKQSDLVKDQDKIDGKSYSVLLGFQVGF